MLVVAVAVVFDNVVFQQDFGVARVHQICDGNAPRHIVSATLNGAIHDTDAVLCARSEIDLGLVGVGGHVVSELAVQDLRRGLPIGGRTDGRTFVGIKLTIVENGVTVHNIDRTRLLLGMKIMKPAIAKRYFAVDDLDAVHFTKPAVTEKAGVRSILKAEVSASHSYWQIMVLILSHGFHRAFDGNGVVVGKRDVNQSVVSVDVKFVVGRDGDVARNEVIKDLRVKTHAATNFNKVIKGIGRAVARACPLGVQ